MSDATITPTSSKSPVIYISWPRAGGHTRATLVVPLQPENCSGKHAHSILNVASENLDDLLRTFKRHVCSAQSPKSQTGAEKLETRTNRQTEKILKLKIVRG
mmetsp:Transcript_4471/g.13561  ORF Transcript_4471/g.13561 Transcript_4471/m.13561 type:complete len:102 (-) Transcript_4471:3381-3686(-)